MDCCAELLNTGSVQAFLAFHLSSSIKCILYRTTAKKHDKVGLSTRINISVRRRRSAVCIFETCETPLMVFTRRSLTPAGQAITCSGITMVPWYQAYNERSGSMHDFLVCFNAAFLYVSPSKCPSAKSQTRPITVFTARKVANVNS